MMPTAKPPSTAPPGLVNPPITAPAKPYSNTPNIMFGSRNTTGAISMPATAPIAAAMPQPSAVIQPTRMPTRRADSGLCGGGAHRQPEPRAAEEQIKQPEHHRVTPIIPASWASIRSLPNSGLVPNGVGKVLIV